MEHWLKFFLVGVAETATSSKQTFERIIHLRQRCEQQIMLLGKRAKGGQALLRQLYSQPIMNINQIAERLKVTHQAASALVKRFEEFDILREVTGYRRNRLFVFSEYLHLFTDTPRSSSEQ